MGPYIQEGLPRKVLVWGFTWGLAAARSQLCWISKTAHSQGWQLILLTGKSTGAVEQHQHLASPAWWSQGSLASYMMAGFHQSECCRRASWEVHGLSDLALEVIWHHFCHTYGQSRHMPIQIQERGYTSPPNGRCVREFGVHVIKPPQISIPLIPSLFYYPFKSLSWDQHSLWHQQLLFCIISISKWA